MEHLQAKVGADQYFGNVMTEDEFYCLHDCEGLFAIRSLIAKLARLKPKKQFQPVTASST